MASGKVHWNQLLTVSAQLKSLPSGELQDEPDGTRISVQDTAAKMISISDNTAANMLIELGAGPRSRRRSPRPGWPSPALDRPFLTTREMFILKLDQWPALAKRYVAANEAGRSALLASTVDRAPLPAVAAAQAWTTPATLTAWNGSPRPMTFAVPTPPWPPSPVGRAVPDRPGALAQRRRPAARPGPVEDNLVQGRIRARGPDPGLPGHHPAGQSYVVIVLAENPSQPINEATAAPVLLSAIKGAFTLAARP